MATIAPPIKPILKTRSPLKRAKYYTLHSNNNNAFSLRLDEREKTAVVGFKNVDDAVKIGSMIETHFVYYKEWPEMLDPASLVLPSPRVDSLVYIFVRVWAFEDIKFECTNNFLDFISIDSITSKKNDAYSLNGNMYTFEVPTDFYRNRLSQLYDMF